MRSPGRRGPRLLRPRVVAAALFICTWILSFAADPVANAQFSYRCQCNGLVVTNADCPSSCTGCGCINNSWSCSGCKSTSCSAGRYYANGRCLVCPVNTYSRSGSTSCANCPRGTTTNNQNGQSGCSALPGCDGSGNGCVPGWGASGSGCAVCGAGTFKSNTAWSGCVGCPTGSSGSSATGATSAASACSCNAGYYGLSGSLAQCYACPVDTYKTSSGNSASCTACPTGATTANVTGATTKSKCVALPGWTYVPSSDSYVCAAGFAAYQGGCVACPAGTYKTAAGSVACTSCPANMPSLGTTGQTTLQGACSCAQGTYQVGSSCASCPFGSTTSGPGATSASSCVSMPGYVLQNGQYVCDVAYGLSGGVCAPCAAGTFKGSVGSSACTACPSGASATSATGQTSITAACLCNAGFYGLASGSTTCTQCPADTYKSAIGNTNGCDACPAGTTTNSATGGASLASCIARPGYVLLPSNATECAVGYGLSGGLCIACPSGTFKSTQGNTACVACPSPSVASGVTGAVSMSAACRCASGYSGLDNASVTSCTKCPASTYKASVGNGASGAVCVPCPQGSSTSSNNGATALSACVPLPGYVPDGAGGFTCAAGFQRAQSVCISCPAGSYKSSPGESLCTPCPTSAVATSANGSTTASQACACRPGYTGLGDATSSSCSACPANTYKDASGAGACVACPWGSTTAGAAAVASRSGCVPSTGYVQDPQSPGSFVCGLGYEFYAPTNSCRMCVDGYKDFIGLGACILCPIFSNWNLPSGQVPDFASRVCQCAAGTTLQSLSNFVSCMQCPPDSYKPNVPWGFLMPCQQCPTGSGTNNTQGATSASQCIPKVGYQSDGNGGFTCSPGYGSSSTGSSCGVSDLVCTACLGGTYKPAAGRGSCLACPSGSTSQAAASGCTCRAGFYGLVSSSVCTACPADSYKSSAGNTASCTACPTGATTNGVVGASVATACVALPGWIESPPGTFTCAPGYTGSSCTACPSGQYKGLSGSAACTVCPTGSQASGSTGQTTAAGACTCTAGYFGLVQSLGNCTGCPPDTFKTSSGNAASCTACPVGATTNGVVGSASAAACVAKPGWTSDGNGGFTCAGGYTMAGGACVACASGTFKGSSGPASCTACPALSSASGATGSLTATDACRCNPGAYGLYGCSPCPADTFKSSLANTASCTACPTGSTTNGTTGASSATQCVPQPGWTSDGNGGFTCASGFTASTPTSCTACPAGTFKGSAGGAACTPCPSAAQSSGAVGQTNAAAACLCAPGYSGLATTSVCTACPADTFKATAGNGAPGTVCVACASGYTTAGATGALACALPDPNSVMCTPGNGLNAMVQCRPCPMGTYQPATGTSRVCIACPSFTTNTSTVGAAQAGDACSCIPGYWGMSPDLPDRCQQCPTDTFKFSSGNGAQIVACLACPWGSSTQGAVGSTSLSLCSAKPGWTPNGNGGFSCSAGYGLTSVGCVACSSGSFAPNPSNSSCATCPAGSVASGAVGQTTAAAACTCSAGYFGLVSTSVCTGCPADTFKSGSGNVASCTACPTGSTTNGASGSTSAAACVAQPGWTSDGNGGFTCAGGYTMAGGACIACASGTFKGNSGPASCTACPALSSASGATGSLTAAAACSCNSGAYGLSGNSQSSCSQCPADSFKSSLGNTASCTACPTGSTTNGALGASTLTSCVALPGWTSDGNGGFTCQPGYGTVGGACVACYAGSFKTTAGSTTCTACPNNSTSAGIPGQTSAADACLCSAGFYGLVGSSVCTACPADTFKSSTGNTASCYACPTGSTTGGSTGSTSSSACVALPGWTSDGSGGFTCLAGYQLVSGSCVKCQAGSFKSAVGPSACNSCPSNSTATTLTGATAATDACSCNAGSFGLADSSATVCAPCPVGSYKAGTANAAACTNCPFGTTTLAPGASSLAGCIVLPGFVSDGHGGYQCDVGFTLSGGACVSCDAGSFKSLAGDGACTPCPTQAGSSGLVGASTAQNACICTAGYYGLDTSASTVCVACPVDTFKASALNGAEGSVCTSCPSGSTTGAVTAATSVAQCGAEPGFVDMGNGTFMCAPGFGQQGSDCLACAVGTFKMAAGNFACTSCPSGASASSSTGATSFLGACVCNAGYFTVDSAACSACPADTYKTASGNGANCVACPAGSSTQGASGSTTASACVALPGWTDDGHGGFTCAAGFGYANGQCSACAAGTFKATAGSTACTACPSASQGSGATGQSSAAAACSCSVGFGLAANSSMYGCSECAPSTYKNAVGNVACAACPWGSTTGTTTGAVDVSACVALPGWTPDGQGGFTCSAGYGTSNGACVPCSSGSFASSPSNSSCTACPANSVASGSTGQTLVSGACSCSQGYYGLLSSSSCAVCPADTFKSSVGNAASCTACPTGSSTSGAAGSMASSACTANPGWTPDGNGGFTCQAGYQPGNGTCVPCPQGTFKGASGAASCSACPTQSSAVPGVSGQTLASGACVCNAGFYGLVSSSVCNACPANTFKAASGNTAGCTACPTGSSTAGASGSSDPSACTALPGWTPDGQGGFTCLPGYTLSGGSCVACAYGTFKSSVGFMACTTCPLQSISTGLTGQTTAAAACSCSAGYYGLVSSGSCTACPVNTFKSSVGNAASCSACPTGSSTNGTTAAVSSGACIALPGWTGDGNGGYTCQPGFFSSNGACVQCAAGSYKPSAGPAACASCPSSSQSTGATGQSTAAGACLCAAGFYGLESTVASTCSACPANTFKTSAGNGPASSSCTACPTGTQTGGASGSTAAGACTASPGFAPVGDGTYACAPGYTPGANNTCVSCPVNTWKSTVGNTACTACPSSSQASGATGQTSASGACMCNAGFYGLVSSSSCTVCPVDTFKSATGNSASCTSCPTGSSTGGVTAAASASACTALPGWTSDGNGGFTCQAGYTLSSGSCVVCPSGTFKASAGAASCTGCPLNSATSGLTGQTVVGSACTCVAGYYGLTQDGNCYQCPADTYKTGSGNSASSCTACPTGSTTNGLQGQTGLVACVARPGYTSDGNGGFVCALGNGYSSGSCYLCPAGTFKNSIGNQACTACVAGSSSSGATGQTSASGACLCNAGFYGLVSSSSCTLCPADTFKSTSGNSASCTSCPTGSTTNSATGSASVSACTALPGWTSDGNGGFTCQAGYTLSSGSCVTCSLGTFKASPGAASCTSCPPNTVASGLTGQTTATGACLCAVGYFGTTGSCAVCPADSFKATAGNTASCTSCPTGSTTNGVTGATSSSACTALPGWTSDGNGGYTCLPGYQPSGGTCAACTSGTFKPASGSTACIPCSSNTITSGLTGQTTPSGACLCVPGFYGTSGSCSMCPADTYKPAPGNAATCTPCPTGSTTSNMMGANSQSACVAKPGWTQTSPGTFVCSAGYTLVGSNCVQCSAGSFKAQTGNGACTLCGSGAISSGASGQTTALGACLCVPGMFYSTAQSQCGSCPIDTYQSVTGNPLSCTSCPMGSTTYGSTGGSSVGACSALPNWTPDGSGGFTCRSGYTLSGGACVACPAGSYKTTAGSTSCTPCPSGLAVASGVVGASFITDACLCAQGYYGLQSGQTTCTQCPADTYKASAGNGASSLCTACATGSSTRGTTGASSSAQCLANQGFVNNGSGVFVCDAGYGYSTGTCSPCAAGTFKSAQALQACTPCPANSTSTGVSGATTAGGACTCIAGNYGPNGAAACVPCPADTVKTINGNGNSSLCVSCVQGTSTFGATGVSNASLCSSLPGYVWNGVNGYTCAQGYTLSGGNCVACAVGAYKTTTGPGSCTACGSTMVASGATGAISASAGCLCPAGSFGLLDGTDNGCQLCPSMSFAASPGNGPQSARCIQCVFGQSTLGLTGQTGCVANPHTTTDNLGNAVCLAGYYYSDSDNDCFSCPVNSYSSAPGVSATCTACPPNSATNGATGASALTQCVCTAGYGNFADATVGCVACPANTFSTGNVQFHGSCTACSIDFGTDPAHPTGATVCSCPAGTFLYEELDDCFPCPEDTYKTFGNQTACTSCQPFYTTNGNTGQTDSSACVLSNAIGFLPDGSPACNIGYLYDPTLNGCFECNMNYYKPTIGNTTCTQCPFGTATWGLKGATSVNNCTAVSFDTANASDASVQQHSSFSIGAILGAAVGGAAFVGLVGAAVLVRRRYQHKAKAAKAAADAAAAKNAAASAMAGQGGEGPESPDGTELAGSIFSLTSGRMTLPRRANGVLAADAEAANHARSPSMQSLAASMVSLASSNTAGSAASPPRPAGASPSRGAAAQGSPANKRLVRPHAATAIVAFPTFLAIESGAGVVYDQAVAQGNHATVYKGQVTDPTVLQSLVPRDRSAVAVKVFSATESDAESNIASFDAEAALLYHVQTAANVARLLAVTTRPDMTLVMRYYHEPLARCLHSKYSEVAPQLVSNAGGSSQLRPYMVLVHDLCVAVRDLHRLDVAHLDIKPSNLLVERLEPGVRHPPSEFPFRLVLGDFGMATLTAGRLASKLAPGHARRALAGDLTANYCAPEAFATIRALDAGASIGSPNLAAETLFQMDIYAVCSTIYEIASLQMPFKDQSPDAIERALSQGQRPDLERLAEPEGELDRALFKKLLYIVRAGWKQAPSARGTMANYVELAVKSMEAAGFDLV